MYTRIFGLLLAAGIGVACTVSSSDDEVSATNESELRGSLATARACAVRDAYANATVGAFTMITRETFTKITGLAAHERATSFSSFEVAGVGRVLVMEYGHGSNADFYSTTGVLLAREVTLQGVPVPTNIWYAAEGGVMTCPAASSSSGSTGIVGSSSSSGSTGIVGSSSSSGSTGIVGTSGSVP